MSEFLDLTGLGYFKNKLEQVKADKDTDAGIGNLAEFDSNGNPVDSGISAADVDKKGSYDENAVVGASEGLIDSNLAGSEQSMVGIRTFSGKNGLADIKQIEGKTVAWNQLTPLIKSGDWYPGGANVTSYDFTNGVATYTTTNSGSDRDVRPTDDISFISGHKYYFAYRAKADDTTSLQVMFYNGGNTQPFSNVGSTLTSAWQRISFLATAGINASVKPRFTNIGSRVATITLTDVVIIDLTLLGIDNLTTVTEVEAWLAANVGLKPYYPYDAGSLLNNDADAIVARGRNQWDEKWEVGGIKLADGETYATTDRIRSKNFIPVIGDRDYYFCGELNNVCFYDSNGLYISGFASSDNKIRHSPAGAFFCKIETRGSYGPVYNHNICINLSDPSFNGQYEPYKRVEKPLNLKEIKVKSPNLWDEEWEVGALNTSNGSNSSSSTNIRTKNYIPVFPSTTYYFRTGWTASGGYLVVCYYDANKAFLSYTTISKNSTFSTPAGASFMRFYVEDAYGTTYNNDICINVNGWANGRYFPHGILTFNGLRSDGTNGDYMTKTELHRRAGNVNLGDLTWTYASQYNNFTSTTAPAGIKGVDYYTKANAICPKYIVTSGSTIVVDSLIVNDNGTILIKTTAYSDAATFKAAMSGVMLNYELAVEEVYELAEPFNGVYRVFEGGTEEVVNESLSAPFLATIAYNEDINERLLDLSKPGFCKGLIDTRSAGTRQGPFAFRQSGGDGVNYMRKILGKTEVWNQLVGDNDTEVTVTSGHKYFAIIGGTVSVATSDGSPISVAGGVDIVTDLTLMFGAGNEPTTADQFRALHPLPYYNYNAGVLKNNAATGLETTGFNQWDEDALPNYGYNTSTGARVSSSNRICNNNPIKILPQTYYAKISTTTYFLFYDAAMNYLGYVTKSSSGEFTPTAGACFMNFMTDNSYGSVYNHDICINRSDASRNGIYEPYWKKEIVLGLNNLACHDENNNAVVVNGLDGVGTAQDELVVVNGWGTKINKKMEEVDLGDLAWSYSGGLFIALVSGRANGANFICPKYVTSAVSNDKTISYNQIGASVYVKDSAYSDAPTFKTAMSGVKLRFELATPKVLTLDNPIPALIEVDNLGTEKRLPEDTADNPQAPFECDSNYSISVANLVRKLNS